MDNLCPLLLVKMHPGSVWAERKQRAPGAQAEGERARERGSRVSSRFAQAGWLLVLGMRPISDAEWLIKAGLTPLQAAAAS
jgi:hypothetical protein